MRFTMIHVKERMRSIFHSIYAHRLVEAPGVRKTGECSLARLSVAKHFFVQARTNLMVQVLI